jgi:hypothetical protein
MKKVSIKKIIRALLVMTALTVGGLSLSTLTMVQAQLDTGGDDDLEDLEVERRR